MLLSIWKHLLLIRYAGRGLPKTLEMTIYVGRACEEVRVALRLCGVIKYIPQHFTLMRPVDLDAGTWEEVDGGPGQPSPVILEHQRVNLVKLATKTVACLYSVTVVRRTWQDALSKRFGRLHPCTSGERLRF
eukprot:jgi/Mesvir1/23971/Mv10734-RA.1